MLPPILSEKSQSSIHCLAVNICISLSQLLGEPLRVPHAPVCTNYRVSLEELGIEASPSDMSHVGMVIAYPFSQLPP